jgi:SAM-dependent methyltransferase
VNVSDRPPPIFDRALQRRRLDRAIAKGAADFLLDWTIAEFRERLATVKRQFTHIADIGTPLPALSLALAEDNPQAPIVRLAPSIASAGPAALLRVVGDEELLPLAPESADLVVSALALQQVNDLPGALIQIRRCLRPDGLFIGALLGGSTLTELRDALAAAEAELTGGVSPRVAPFADVRDMGGLLQRAGFALPVTDSEPLTVRYANVFALFADLRAMGATNTLVERSRRPTRRQVFLRAAQIYAERFADPDGRIRASFEVIFLSGWAPHESQQKPLAPGSAKVRLADVLGNKAREPE